MNNIIINRASRGIAAANAKRAAARGDAVCINNLKQQKAAEKIVAEIISNGGKAIAVSADISNESDIVRMFDTVDVQLGTSQYIGKQHRYSSKADAC